MFGNLTWEEQHIIGEYSKLAYYVFTISCILYFFASQKIQPHKIDKLILIFVPVLVLLVTISKLTISIIIHDSSIFSKVIESFFGFFLLPPTNIIFMYFSWRNYCSVIWLKGKPIGYGWFVLLIIFHVPLSAFMIYMEES